MADQSKRPRGPLPAEPAPESICALIDTREKDPWRLEPLRTERASLVTGDYTINGLKDLIAIERKSLPDLIGCVGTNRKRFEKEIKRLLAYPCRAVIVEASWDDLEAGEWRAQVRPSSVIGSALSWISRGVPIVLAGDRERADKLAARLLFQTARREWRRLRVFQSAAIGANGSGRTEATA